MKQYSKTSDGHIYRYCNNISSYRLMSPKKNDTVREIIPRKEFTGERMKSRKALTEINSLWREHVDEWEYNGMHYITVNSTEVNRLEIPSHKFSDNNFYPYAVVSYHGQLKWLCFVGYYLPRVQLMTFEHIDRCPCVREYMQEKQWAHLDNVKFVYCKETRQYI